MAAAQLRETFLALPANQKAGILALLAHNLTIGARTFYPGQVEEHKAGKRLSSLNELQHTVTAKLIELIRGEPLDFPDEGFLEVLFEKAQQGACEGALIEAFQWAFAVKE